EYNEALRRGEISVLDHKAKVAGLQRQIKEVARRPAAASAAGASQPHTPPLDKVAAIAAEKKAQFAEGDSRRRPWVILESVAMTAAGVEELKQRLGDDFNDDVKRVLRQSGIRVE